MVFFLLGVLGVATLIVVGQAGRLRHLQAQIKDRDARIDKIKTAALYEVGKARDEALSVREQAASDLSTLTKRYADAEQQWSDRLMEMASRPPTVIPAPAPAPAPDLAALIEAVGQSVAHVAYGPARPQLTEAELHQATYDLTRNLDPDTLGAPSGDWMPDVEMDEWMNEHGVPNKPGWIAGTAPPTMQSRPDSNVDEPFIPSMAQAPRHNGDQAMFASGDTGPRPQGGVE